MAVGRAQSSGAESANRCRPGGHYLARCGLTKGVAVWSNSPMTLDGPRRRMPRPPHVNRESRLWLAGAVTTFVLLLPALTAAARSDTKLVVTDARGVESFARHGAGLFWGASLLVSLPALCGALIGRRGRSLNVIAVVLSLAIGLVCEMFVSLSSPWTF